MHRIVRAFALVAVVGALSPAPALAKKAGADAASRALDEDLTGLAGWARAEKLLSFAAKHPSHARTAAAVEEARELVADLVAKEEAELKALRDGLEKAAAARGAAERELAGARDALQAGKTRADQAAAELKAAREQAETDRAEMARIRGDRILPSVSAVFLAPDEGARKAAVKTLAALLDPRSVPAIGYIARRDASPGVRTEAARALGAYVLPQAEKFAEDIARDGDEDDHVRVAAVQALGAQRTDAAGDALAQITRDRDHPVPVRQAAADALRTNYPELAAKLQIEERVADSSGRPIFTATGAAVTAYSLALVGALSPNAGPGTVIGAAGGLVIGGVGAWLLGSGNVRTGDALFMASAAAWSVPVGWELGMLSGGKSASCSDPVTGDLRNACTATALATHLAAVGGSWLLRDHLSLRPLDAVEINAATLSGLFIALGASMLPSESDEVRPVVGALAAGQVAGFALGTYFAPKLHLTLPLAWLTVLGAGQAAWTGGWLGAGLIEEHTTGPLGSGGADPERERRIGGLSLLGLGAGLGAMLAASSAWKPGGSDAAVLTFALLGGDILGAGLPFLVAGDSGERGAKIGTALGGLATAATAGLLTDSLELKLSPGGSLLVGVGSALAAWQGFGWAAYAEMKRAGPSSQRLTPGVGLTVTGAAMLGLVGAAQYSQLSGWHAAWMYSGAVWGGWLAYWTAYIFDARSENKLAAALAGSDAGLLATMILLSPLVDISPNTAAWVSVFGVGGATLAALGATFFYYQGSGHQIATANVVGSVLGMIAGGVLAPKLPGHGSREPGGGADGFLPGVPMIQAMPMVDPHGRVSGMGAQLAWAL